MNSDDKKGEEKAGKGTDGGAEKSAGKHAEPSHDKSAGKGAEASHDKSAGKAAEPSTGKSAAKGADAAGQKPSSTGASAPVGGTMGALNAVMGTASAAIDNAASIQLGERLTTLRTSFNALQGRVMLEPIETEVNRMVSDLQKLPEAIAEVRARGYTFAAYLERKAEVLAQRWGEIESEVRRTIERESHPLRSELDDYAARINTANQRLEAGRDELADNAIDELETNLAALTSRIEAVERRLRSSYQTLTEDTRQLDSQLDKIRWYLERIDEASFKLLAGESVFMVAEAEWVASGRGKDDPNGYLYLTDQRMIFEQSETVGRKLGMFGGQHVREVEWDIPLTRFEDVTAENKGMFGGKDMLNFTLGAGAPYPRITVEVLGDAECRFWEKQIRRMTSGDVQDERAIPPDPEVVEMLRSAPSKCHVCGATVPAIMAGQMQVECAYCGTVIRLA